MSDWLLRDAPRAVLSPCFPLMTRSVSYGFVHGPSERASSEFSLVVGTFLK